MRFALSACGVAFKHLLLQAMLAKNLLGNPDLVGTLMEMLQEVACIAGPSPLDGSHCELSSGKEP